MKSLAFTLAALLTLAGCASTRTPEPFPVYPGPPQPGVFDDCKPCARPGPNLLLPNTIPYPVIAPNAA